jgi:hypothetical protein
MWEIKTDPIIRSVQPSGDLMTEDDKQRLESWSRSNPIEYCPYVGTGSIQFDPGMGTKHFEPWWMLLVTDQEIIRYYAWLLKKHGKPLWLSTLWGAHVSAIKHQEPPDKKLWGTKLPEVTFRYTDYIRWDNGTHAWLDVYSPELSRIRQLMGLPAKEWFHLTIGRLV